MIRTLALIGTIVMFISCDSSIVFEEYKSFENQNWNTDSAAFFNYTITDTTSTNTVKIKLRHTVEYEFQNLILFVETDVIDTVELMLANKEGMWLGGGIGDVREFEFEYQNAKLFSKKGNYSFKIEQAMRYGMAEKIQVLNNVLAVGLSIEKQNE
ncbi:MAG: Gliding motility lipoprotein GldH [Cryomorphaceae bacterium]|nr:MAG: Gliding motility lipoprotein GldH [Cryomorphaceae bacterium]|tara:strand:- start:289 stop:753 length:465 start_codon:yes stop_codon:yes gene_type:complete